VRAQCAVFQSAGSHNVRTVTKPDVKCWDVQCPMSDVFFKQPTDNWSPLGILVSLSFGHVKNTSDMGHWTSQHLTSG
jgi:hypothetical protein